MSATRPPAYDERYAAPVEASRRGAHRARPNPLTSIVPVIAGMAVVVLVVVGAFTLLGDRGSPAGGNVNAAPTTSPSASSSSAPSSSPSASAGSASATGGADAVDKTIELRVLNSTETGGLAKKFSTTLGADGWTVGQTGDANQRGLATTLVYYGKTSQKASAQAIVDKLGFGKTKKSAANAGDGITVVLGADAAAA